MITFHIYLSLFFLHVSGTRQPAGKIDLEIGEKEELPKESSWLTSPLINGLSPYYDQSCCLV